MSETKIKEFLQKMVTQDNRSTGFPFFYVIRTEEWVSAPLGGYETKVQFYWNDNTYDSLEEIEDLLTADGCTEKEIREAKSEAQEYGIKPIWSDRGMFLTETDAKSHLETNHYHYSANAHTYVKHAWRAPELSEFFKNLFEHFEVKAEK